MAHRLKYPLSVLPRSNDHPIPERRLAEALAERSAFLERNPQHRKLQDEIDRILDKAGTSENRMAVLALLMEAKLMELQGQLHRLHRLFRGISQ